MLVPKAKPQKLNVEQWDEVTPYENKMELINGEALWGGEERDRMLLGLVYNTGLEHFVNILPESSKEELKNILEE